MKISRWITFPLLYTFAYSASQILARLVFGEKLSVYSIFIYLVGGVFVAFIIQYFSYKRARRISEDKDVRAFDFDQTRVFAVLLDYEKAFELCKQSLTQWKSHIIEHEDVRSGVITVKIKKSEKWYEIAKVRIRFDLKKINEDLTQIEISTVKNWRNNYVIAGGHNWKIVEDISKYIKKEDAEMNKKILTDSAVILDEVYVKPFQKQTQN